LPALEGVAGIFDNATTTYPLSVIAAVLMILNWRGLHGALVRALRKRYGFWGYLVYSILLLSALASLLKPIVFWQLPEWSGLMPAAGLLRVSATVDATAFIFEYLVGVYIQVYLITVCLAWIRGLSFEEGELFRFAMRRFSYVLEWAGIVVAVSTLILRVPLVLAYFIKIPRVLDYLPIARVLMSGLIIAFCSVQISLVLHNETLIAAMRAHIYFIQKNAGRLAWFLVICGIHFYGIMACDAILRARSPIDWARCCCGNSVSRVCEARSRPGCWLHGSACFGNAKQAEFTRKNGFNIDQTGCEKANVNAATITRQSKSNLALAFVSLGRERKRDITIFYAFCRVVDDIADSAELSVIEKRVRLANWRQMLRTGAPDEPLLASDVRQLMHKYSLHPTCSRKSSPE
jgi:Phytoene/squalene synthetase